MSVEKYVPITDLNNLQSVTTADLLTWDVSLPPTVDAERIVVNQKRLGTLANIGAFRSFHILEEQGSTSTHDVSISGIGGYGTATAGLAGKKQEVDIHRSALVDDVRGPGANHIMPSHGKTRVLSLLNKAEMASRVVDCRQRDKAMPREKAWARELDSAFKQSLRDTSRRHLVGREERSSIKYWSRGYYSYVAAFAVFDIADKDVGTWPLGILMLNATTVGIEAMTNKARYGDHLLRDRRWSINGLSAEQWDRYAAVRLYSAAAPLISYRK